MTDRVWPKFDLSEEMNNMSLGEMEEFEDHTGLTFTALSGGFPAKAITYIMFLAYRRSMPDITLDEVRTRTIQDLGGVAVEEASDDPS